MIFVTGDCHGDYRRFSTEIFPEQKQMSKEDYVIICGDFGYWKDTKEQRYWLDWLEEKPFTTLWVDGNHENYDLLKEVGVEEWNGGNVQYIRPSVIHLMRGQVFEIDEMKFFSFGGASSHDIDGGILEQSDPGFRLKRARLVKRRIPHRINHVSWWTEELPSEEEMAVGRRNLEKHDWKVDFIFTHCCATSTQVLVFGVQHKPDILTDYLEEIRQKCEFKGWFFGHYHDNRRVSKDEFLLYEQIIRIL